MNLASLGCLALLLLMELLCYSNADQEEDPDHIFSGDAVLFAINEATNTPTSWLACSKYDCDFSKRQTTENFYTYAKKVFHIYGKGRVNINDPIRYGDEVALFYRVNDDGDGLWLGCASGKERCGLGTCPGLPHLNHWMWNSKHSCDENKFLVTGSEGLQNGTLLGQPVRIEHQIKLVKKSNHPSIASGKRHMGKNSSILMKTPFLDNFGNWVINKDTIGKCGNKHYDFRYKVCDRCGSDPYIRPKRETWKCCAGEKPYNTETSLCCGGSVSKLYNTHRSAKEARCCLNAAFFPDKQVCCQGNVRDLPGQDTDADDPTVQCCGSEPYLTTHGICCNDVLTPFYPQQMNEKDALECCDDQGFNNRTSFCYSCGKKKHVLLISEKQSWSCCKDKDIYKDGESRCCKYGLEKGNQCRCLFQNNSYISGQRFSDGPASTSCRSCVCNDGESVCDRPVSCPYTLPSTCTFYPNNDECCPIFQCFNSEIHNYKLFLRRKSHVSIVTAIPEMTAMTISFWMKTQQDSEGTALSYATQSQPDELVIKTHPRVKVLLKGQGSERDLKLNDGNWHFLWIMWESSSGHLAIKEGENFIGPEFYTQSSLEGGGYLVLGQRQQSQKQFIEAKAFVGEISHVNIWNEKRTDFEVIRKDCIGLHTGSIFHMSENTVDSHQSASIISADICPDKALQFPYKGVTDYVKITSMPNTLTEFTLCLWMRSSDTKGSLFSYAIAEEDNELRLFYNNYFELYIGGEKRETQIPANDGAWHHICVSWSSSGEWKFYKDGLIKHHGTEFQMNHQIRHGGSSVLGQEQDSVGGGFDAGESFTGMLFNLNLWNEVLSAAQIEDMSTACLLDEWNAGNVYKWRDFIRESKTGLLRQSTCLPLGEDNAFHFPNKGDTDFVKLSNMPSISTAFTVCLWMNSRDTQGTLVSYAVGAEKKELLIKFNIHFSIHIRGTEREITSSVSAFTGSWHQICVTWESSGTWKFYKDGELKDQGTDFMKNHEIRPGGTLVLGQEQGSLVDGFDPNKSFQGMLSNVNVWNLVLDAIQIEKLSKFCLMDEASDHKVYKWSHFLRQGGTSIVIPSPCTPVEIGNALKFQHKGTTDVVKISNMPHSLTAFTVCLWMSSSEEQGTLVSYAVGDNGDDNEVLLEYKDRDFNFLIHNRKGWTRTVVNDGEWHHICLSWEKDEGAWEFYKDGGLIQAQKGLKKNSNIRSGGTLVLGQEQDSVGDDFDRDQSFKGMLFNVNIWDRVLTATMIQEISSSSSCLLHGVDYYGNVYKWLDFLREAEARLLEQSSCAPFGKDYAFDFPEKGVNDYVKIYTNMPHSLTAFTVCLWMSSSEHHGTLVSYNVPGDPYRDNVLLIEYIGYFYLVIGNRKRPTSVTANDGLWHHICVTWESSSGSWKFYKDCILNSEGTDFQINYEIQPRGILVLGQEQDQPQGGSAHGFSEDQSFKGMLSNVNMWDHVLSAAQVTEMSMSCQLDERNEANLFKWSDFLRFGIVKLVKPSPCEPYMIMNHAFNFPAKGSNYVKMRGMRRLTEFTVCLWMSSSDTQGTLVSYAEGAQNKELLIAYDRHFSFHIRGIESTTSLTANDGAWHHVCLSWTSNTGSWKIYKDGFLKDSGLTNNKNPIRPDGTLELGKSYKGMISDVNIWDRVLHDPQIEKISATCVLDEWNEANVYKWSDFLRQGGAMLLKPSPCKPFMMLDYAFNFLDEGTNDVVKISNMPHSLTAFTVCLWMSSSDTQGTLVSYAVDAQNKELLIKFNEKFVFRIRGTQRDITVAANDGVWHHICVTWESSSGSWKFYKDGDLVTKDTDVEVGNAIREGGTLVLGQEQRSVGGGFVGSQSYKGMISDVNIWDKELSDSEIIKKSQSCQVDGENEGNVYKWSNFLNEGGVRLVHPPNCKMADTDNAFHFTEADVVKISGMKSLEDFTVCLWMSSSDPRGTLVRYEVDDDNELVIEYNDRDFIIETGAAKRKMTMIASDGKWHHICLSRKRESGEWKIYKDGYLMGEGTGLSSSIRPGGTLMLGQKQASVGEEFYEGKLTNVNVWDKVLTATYIENMAYSCHWDGGNDGRVYKWIDFIRQGGASLVQSPSCEALGTDYAFHFLEKEDAEPVTDYVELSDMPSISTAFTVCLWMSSTNTQGTLVSYAEGGDNKLLIEYNSYFAFSIGDRKIQTSVTANDGVWHHICVSWQRTSEMWKFYKDGDLKQHDTNFRTNYEIPQGGTLVLGQRQSGDNFDSDASFQGKLSNVNVWDQLLGDAQIKKMSQSCLLDKEDEGNVYKWSDFLLEGGAMLVKPSQCTPFINLDYAFEFLNEGANDVVKISNMPHSLTAFTVCLWMSSSEEQGTLVSYAVDAGNSNDNEELLIKFNGPFNVLIGGDTLSNTLVSANDGEWHHICLSWEKDSGSWKFYKDGDLGGEGHSHRTDHTIQQGGTLVLGQNQDSTEPFKGKLSNVNIWDNVLSGEKVQEMSKSCQSYDRYEGNVYKWNDFLREGGPKLVQSSTCKPVEKVPGGKTLPTSGDWIYHNGHYYFYREKSVANSWFSAEGVCREYGDTVHLTSIHSQEENDFIKALSSGKEEQWIGLTDHNTASNTFKWIDRSPYGGFTHWAQGEPNQATIDEDCGAMKPDGTWVDVDCRKQRLESDTPLDQRAFTCKTSGNTLSYEPSPSVQQKVKEEHDPTISVVDLTSGGQSSKITFFTGLHYIAPNEKFISKADKVKYGALLKFGGYVGMTFEQLGALNSQLRRDATQGHSGRVNDADDELTRVADLDGIVDKIEIPYYSEMSTMGSPRKPGYSIEFWIRPRRMPVDAKSMALFGFKSSSSSGSMSLKLNVDGSLALSMIHNRETQPICTTEITDETHKVKALRFQHIAVTGTVGHSLKIKVNGEIACESTTSVSLAVSGEGALVFGENAGLFNENGRFEENGRLKRFNGQISNIQLFNTERTNEQIGSSIRVPNPTASGSIGFWSLRQSDEINMVNYVISNSQTVHKLQALEDYDPPLIGFPVEAVTRNQNIYIVRLTGEGHVVVRKFKLADDERSLSPMNDDSMNQKIIESSQAKKGCLAATRDEDRDRLIIIECFAEDQSPGALRFKWNFFEINGQGQSTASPQNGGQGSILVTGIGSLDTRLSAKIVNNHLLLTAGTTSNSAILFLDLTLNSNGLPSLSVDKLAVQPVGPEITSNGATYYAYLSKGSSGSYKPFLRRLSPANGQTSNSYIISERNVNPSRLLATDPITNDMPDNDWFWFLFKISTINSGVTIQSGERINIQTPNDKESWSYVKLSCQTLQADQHVESLNFWIFKTKSCDPKNGGFSVVSGEIGPNDCILLWPKTEQFYPGYNQQNNALPTDREIENAKVRFGSWFGPWRLMIPMKSSPERPIPVTGSSTSNSPRNVNQGNKYALLHFGEGISLPPPSSQAGVRGGLLQFAKTTVTPSIVSNDENPASVKLIFRGNGGSLPLPALPHDEKAKLEVLFSNVFQEGSYAQRRMTTGLFYSISYTVPSDSASPGEFKNLARIGGLKSLEYPNPPTSFVWLIPPPFKVSGMCAAISTLFQFNDDTVNDNGPNSVKSLTEIITRSVGPGSFGEGLFKPFLTVHFDVTLLNKIGEQIHTSLMSKIREHIPKPPPAPFTNMAPTDTHSWQEIGDLEACVYLSNSTFWKDKVQIRKIKDKLNQVMRSEWMNNEMNKIREQVAPNFLREASARYSVYGGIAVLIATRLRSKEFLEELVTNDKSFVQPILDSHLKILDFIRPDLGIAVRQDIMSAILAKAIIAKPWTILQSLDEEKQREAISAAITAIMEGPNVPEEVKKTFKDVTSAIFYPLTSTQLGVFSNFLDMRKLDVLAALDDRGSKFKNSFLDIFVQKRKNKFEEINEANTARRAINFDSLERVRYDVFRGEASPSELKEKSLEFARTLNNIEDMPYKRYQLRNSFSERLEEADLSLTKVPKGLFYETLQRNPRFVVGLSHTINILGTVSAAASILIEITDSDSDLRQGDGKAIASTVATIIGAAGSFTDLVKVLKEKLCKPRSTEAAEELSLQRTSEELTTFEEELATEVSVDLNNMERYSSRLARMAETKTIGRAFTVFGVVADVIFLGISISDLVEDFNADSRDDWQIVDDFLLATSAGIGAALGVATFAASFGVAAASTAATGIGALIVLAVGLIAVILEAVRERVRADQEKERQCDEWKEWCSWSQNLFHHYGFLKDSDTDPCSNCPTKKHHILRIMHANPGLFPSALKKALINGLDSGKDVKRLIPSLRKIEKKTCPAWLRLVFKRHGKRRRSCGSGNGNGIGKSNRKQ